MTAAIGVLCARVRLEEKQLLAALAEAGVPARPLAPAASPFPCSPVPVPLGPVGQHGSTGHPTDSTRDGASGIEVVVDRLADRTLAAALLPLWTARGAAVLGAGQAATGNRAVVTAALASAGLPQPRTFLVSSEESALAALAQTGYPATLMPLSGGGPISLWDRDCAEAIVEHRNVLGDAADAIVLVQAGAPVATERALVHVVGGAAVAAEDPGGLLAGSPAVAALAEAAARTLGASVAAVELALTPSGFVVWDVQPVADFRNAAPIGDRSAAEAIAALAAARLAARPAFERAVRVQIEDGKTGNGVEPWPAEAEQGAGHDAVLTA